jgi:hypothetical protein
MSNFDDDDFLKERKASNAVYIQICEGQLCQRRATPAPGFEDYILRFGKAAGKTVYLRRFDEIKGIVTGFRSVDKETHEGNAYKVFQVTFSKPDGSRHAILETPLRSELVARFAKCVENMELGDSLLMRPFLDKKNQTCIYFEQDGKSVPQKYTSTEPNGLPAWVKDETTGEWDNRDYWKFLFNILVTFQPIFERNKHFLEKMQAAEPTPAPEPESAPEPVATAAAAGAGSYDDSDIPF